MIYIEKGKNKKKAKYLLGESMGGALALLLHRKQPSFWNGAILVAPMCKVINFDYYLFTFFIYLSISYR